MRHVSPTFKLAFCFSPAFLPLSLFRFRYIFYIFYLKKFLTSAESVEGRKEREWDWDDREMENQ